MNIKKNMISGALTVALMSMPLMASAAGVFQEFTINENSVPGVNDANYSAVVGDKLNGSYTEILTLGNTPDINGNLSFETWGYATFSSLLANEGVDTVDSYLGSVGGSGYLIRALFYSTGLYNTISNTFTGASATIDMIIDADKNTSVTFGADASVTPTLSNTGDDYSIGTATNAIRLAGIPGTPGAFDFIWDDFLLTSGSAPADGDSYFIAPRPFHLVLQSNGDFDQPNFAPGTFTLGGDLSAVYLVPEPGTLALLGLGFLGLGAKSRRKI